MKLFSVAVSCCCSATIYIHVVDNLLKPFFTHALLALLINVNANVNVEFKVTLHEQVRYMGTLQY